MSTLRDLLGLGPDHPWMDDAACIEHDPEIFFPEQGEHRKIMDAKQICGGCEALARCREWVLDEEARGPMLAGIYAGLTTAERRRLRRRLCREPGCGVSVSGSARYCDEHSLASRRKSKSAYDRRTRLAS